MKHSRKLLPYSLLLILITCSPFLLLSGNVHPNGGKVNWNQTLSASKVFIANTGQYNGIAGIEGKVMFGIHNPREEILFTTKGVNFVYTTLQTKPKASPLRFWKKNKKEEHEKEKETEGTIKKIIVSVEWKNANQNVEVVAQGITDELFYFGNPLSDLPYKCATFKKIIYKNLYNGIDVEYSFHKTQGIKYNLIVHPNADASQIEMLYSGISKIIKTTSGNLLITTTQGTITDHAPVCFQGEKNSEIKSSFHVNGKSVKFVLDNYDKSKQLIIDPWVVSPAFTTTNRGYDLVRNNTSGDIYVFGAHPPYELKRFNSSGLLLSTYIAIPLYAAASTFYGDVCMDPSGNIYLSSGCCSGNIIKLNPITYAVLWNQAIFQEPWRMAYNTTNNQLVVVGYALPGGENLVSLNPATGNISNSAVIISGAADEEPRSVSISPTGNIQIIHVSPYPFLDSSSNYLSSNTPALTNIYAVLDHYLIGEIGAFYAVNDSFSMCNPCVHGFNGLAPTQNFIYTYDGATIYKRDLVTGAAIASVVADTGAAEDNSGIAVDSCGNVFVGTHLGVSKYDANLNFLASEPTSGAVYEVMIGTLGEILACGDGFVTSIIFPCNGLFISASGTPPLCNGSCTGTATATIFMGAPPFTYLWNTGATSSSISALCAGTYTVTVTDSTGISTTSTVNIIAPAAITITATSTPSPCGALTGTATASATGGTGSYSYLWTPGTQTTPTAIGLSPTTYTVTVTDTNSCTQTQTVIVLSGPPPSLNASHNNINCFGDCTGSITTSATLGTAPYSYTWSSGQTTPGITNLCAATYTCTVTDNYGCTGTQTIAVTQSPDIVLSQNIIPCQDNKANAQATVNVAGGSPSYTFVWNTLPVQSAPTATQLISGIYIVLVTDSLNCNDSLSITIPPCPQDSIFIPNTFTPNGDGVNDEFVIFTKGYNALECEIYNRWGTKLYGWNSTSGSWNGSINGRPASDGIYYFIYKATRFDGEVNEGKGYLQLISGK